VRRGSGTVGDIMDRVTVECMCRVAASLQEVRESVRARDPALYLEVKDYIFDAFERMGILCDCAPARLVEGRVDDIMANL
jgi:hypothetical protein